MKLKKLFVIGVLTSLVVLSTISVIAISYNQEMEKFLVENKEAEDIYTSIFGLNLLTNEYIIYKRERTKQQWVDSYYNLKDRLDNTQMSDEETQKSVISIRKNTDKLKDQFLILAEYRREKHSIHENKSILPIEEIIVSQMLMISQDIVLDSNKISERSRDAVIEIATIRSKLIIIISATTIALFMMLFFALSQFIINPLEKLREGTKKISDGELNYKLDINSDDEFGELSKSFNIMGKNLKKSLDSLKSEIDSKTIIEQHLRDANNLISTSEERLRNTLESMFEGCQIIGYDWRYLFTNEAAAKHWRRKSKDIIGKTLMECCEGVEKTELFAKLKVVMDERMPMRFDYALTYPDGESRLFSFSVQPMNEGIFIVSMDITDRKNAENEIRKYIEQLESQRITTLNLLNDIDKTNKKLEQANKEIMKVNKELESYTYVVSHDLKQPLRSMKSFSQFLIDDYQDKIDDRGKDYLKRIVNASDRMENLITSLLKLSRVGRVDTELTQVDLKKVVDEAIQDLEDLIKTKKGVVEAKKLPKIYCQRVWMKEVFTNLISNGLKFNESPKPKVKIGYIKNDGDYEFYVQDNGIGIEKQYHERIFKLFERLHSHKYYEGSGAGLTIIKSIIEHHRGRIWIEDSKPGTGTIFKFTLPIEVTSNDKRS
ncbi:MAG: HAMP domain-containing protein [Candidatus Altiarchaeota archaeon]|nr:HAMP domain-containing protein [Candidatus Altiarchaeota archaeon]